MTPSGSRRLPGGLITIVFALFLLLAGARTLAGWLLDYDWWKEVGQVSTWFSMMLYSVGPGVGCWLIAFAIFWIAHARGMKNGGARLGLYPTYARLTTLAILVVAILFAASTVDAWTIVRFFGGRSLHNDPNPWRDPAFGQPLAFYLFDLPFYRDLLTIVLGLCVLAALFYWITSRGWQIFLSQYRNPDHPFAFNITQADLTAALEAGFVRTLAAIFLLGMAVRAYLNRYDLLLDDHGFMVGLDWTSDTIRLPLVWLTIAGSIAAAAFVWLKRYALAVAFVVIPFIASFLPAIVNALYVRPNEISIQRAYIQRHVEATRSAYGLNNRLSEKDFPAKAEAPIDLAKNRVLLDNVRLWDWRAFHDTVSQIQPLRPYTFSDTDVDRYTIDGQMRQVLVAPREIDLNQLGDARSRWINPHFVYTHGYGLVMAESALIDSNGLPKLIIRDAPPIISTPSLKLTRPEIYYGEEIHEPVFVNTGQPEFNYPSGAENEHTRYAGTGGFPISSLFTRFAAALSYGDWNILLTSQLQPNSRMMIHRSVRERLGTIAAFVHWDKDPYLVVGGDGRLSWIVDGYLTSGAHPYSRSLSMANVGTFNYIRNSVKGVVDAYNGTIKLYVFDPNDPLIRAYQNLFPALFTPESEMPPDLRAHARYPETMFIAQAEIYRTYHMRDPEAFYNKADLWDIARGVQGQEGEPQTVSPTYVVARMPGDDKPEFTLMVPFTPRNKDNLIGLLAAHCDGPHLGELNVLLLSKQEILLGPMQVQARINQDQNISKDLTLWNQQGSQVLRGQLLVLPIDNTFVYVEPIYIQAKEARMPQLKKVVVASGNRLIYSDTYEQALAVLAGTQPPAAAAPPQQQTTAAPAQPAAPAAPAKADPRLDAARGHLRRYRELMSQGKFADAGRELEAIESILK
jgi:uncharacterized membrane protein (UPF0182 family)